MTTLNQTPNAKLDLQTFECQFIGITEAITLAILRLYKNYIEEDSFQASYEEILSYAGCPISHSTFKKNVIRLRKLGLVKTTLKKDAFGNPKLIFEVKGEDDYELEDVISSIRSGN